MIHLIIFQITAYTIISIFVLCYPHPLVNQNNRRIYVYVLYLYKIIRNRSISQCKLGAVMVIIVYAYAIGAYHIDK
jgi:hypothetical protein